MNSRKLTCFGASGLSVQVSYDGCQYNHLLLGQSSLDVVQYVGTLRVEQVLVHKLEYLRC